VRYVQPWSNEHVTLLKVIRNIHGSINDNTSFLLKDMTSFIKTKRIENLERFNVQTFKKAVAFRRLGEIFLDLNIMFKRFTPNGTYLLKKEQNSKFNVFPEHSSNHHFQSLHMNSLSDLFK